MYGLMLYVDCILTGLWCLFLSSFCLIKKGEGASLSTECSQGRLVLMSWEGRMTRVALF